MPIQQTNPLTDNANIAYSEVGENGFVSADLDTGLIYGTVQLPPKTDPDKWYQQLCGKVRPDAWKAQLEEIVRDHSHADLVPDILLECAKDILDPSSDTHVLVTTLDVIDIGRRFGVLPSISVHGVDATNTSSLTEEGINPDGTPAKALVPAAKDGTETTPPPTDQLPTSEQAASGKGGKSGKSGMSAIGVADSGDATRTGAVTQDAPGDAVGNPPVASSDIAVAPATGTDAESEAEAARLSALNQAAKNGEV